MLHCGNGVVVVKRVVGVAVMTPKVVFAFPLGTYACLTGSIVLQAMMRCNRRLLSKRCKRTPSSEPSLLYSELHLD